MFICSPLAIRPIDFSGVDNARLWSHWYTSKLPQSKTNGPTYIGVFVYDDWNVFSIRSVKNKRLYWSDSVRRRWKISLPGMRWGCSGSLDMLGYEVLRSPTSSQGAALFWSLWDLSRAWQSLDRIHEEDLDAGCATSSGHGGEDLVTPKARLEN